MLPRMSLMNCWNVAGPFVRPNGMTLHSYDPYHVLNAVFGSSPSAMQTKWYACLRSIFEYILAGPGAFSKLAMSGNGYRSFLVTLLSAQKSMQSLSPPSFFLTNRTGKPHRDLVGHMNPFFMFSSKNLWSAVSLGCEREYTGP